MREQKNDYEARHLSQWSIVPSHCVQRQLSALKADSVDSPRP